MLIIYACGVTGYSEKRTESMTRGTFFSFVQYSHFFVGFLFCILSNKDPKKSSSISANLIPVAQTGALVEQATSVHGAGMNLPVGLNSKIKIIILL